MQGGAEVHAGDRVLFRRNDKRFGVHNGDLATVIEVTTADKKRADRPSRSRSISIAVSSLPCRCRSRSRRSAYDANNLSLGYCVTTHKSQGATVENTYVFLYGAMTDVQMAYVQVSRARDKTRIYTTKDEAGPELSDLAQAMSRNRKKAMAHDAIEGGVTPTGGAKTEEASPRTVRRETR